MEILEQQIIRQCQKGNLEEFEKLYDRYSEKYTALSITRRIISQQQKTLPARHL